MKHILITLLMVAVSVVVACTDNTSVTPGMSLPQEVSVNLAVQSESTNDPMSFNQDDTFGSIAIYLFNNDAGYTLDKSALQPSFASSAIKEIAIQTQTGSKILYLIANYANKTFRLTNGMPVTLTPETPKSVLDQITVESSDGFSPGSLLMVGKQVLNFAAQDNGTTKSIALRRLQARIDVHVYKGTNWGNNTVTLQSVALRNAVFNSEVAFDYPVTTPQMLNSPMFNIQQTVNNTQLLPPDAIVPQPKNAQAVFYSYQNLVTLFSPIQVTAPYLEIKVASGNLEKTYKGYLTDSNQTANKYSLLPNNVYQISAILDLETKIQMNITVKPWNQQSIDYQKPVTAGDFSFAPWASSWGGIQAKTMNTNVGGLEDAVFLFELKTPAGAAWTATLTNGLDFTFATSTAGTTITPVSKGFTNTGQPALIAVRATKRWTGEVRTTDFYINVEGREIPINPVVGTQRRYEGTDTRIIIKQVASYN